MLHAFTLAATLFMRRAFGRVQLPLSMQRPAQLPLIWIVHDEPDEPGWLQPIRSPTAPFLTSTPFHQENRSAVLPKLVLLDLNMQRQSGLKTLQALRATVAFYQLPVMILTTSDAQLDQEMAVRFGSGGFSTRPVKEIDAVKLLQELALYQQLKVDH